MSRLDDNWRASSGPARLRPHGNLFALRAAVVVAFLILGAQLFRMQVVDGEEYARRSRENHITQTTSLAPRGLIVDRNGVPLVRNTSVYVATVLPELLPESEQERYQIYLRLEKLVGVPALEIQAQVKEREAAKQGFIEIEFKKRLDKEQALRLAEAVVDIPGVGMAVRPGREYIATEFSHILGYVGKLDAAEYAALRKEEYAFDEVIGKAGIEARYEKDLRGERGVTSAEQDAQGRLIEAFDSTDAVPGNSVRLALDAGLQSYVSELLTDSLKALGNDELNGDARVAAAVVMDARTGAVLAIVSVPSYDNNIWSAGEARAAELQGLLDDEAGSPLLNKALSNAAPGSTFKLVTAAAALETGRITPATTRNVTSAKLELKGEDGQPFYLDDWRAHGLVDLYRGIAWSSNIYFFQASCGILGESRGLGKNTYDSATILAYYARQFGFDSPTGIDIGGEESGLIPDPAWKARVHKDGTPGDRDWYYGDTCNMGIGQGDVTATPLQVARMTAAVANGGKLLTPHVAAEIVGPDGKIVRKIEPEWKQVPVDPKYLADIRRGMHESVLDGAGALGAVPGIDVAGKTGTAQFIDYKSGDTFEHAWFTGFAPFDNPEIVVTVYFDRGVGGSKAAPVAARIIQYYWENVR